MPIRPTLLSEQRRIEIFNRWVEGEARFIGLEPAVVKKSYAAKRFARFLNLTERYG